MSIFALIFRYSKESQSPSAHLKNLRNGNRVSPSSVASIPVRRFYFCSTHHKPPPPPLTMKPIKRLMEPGTRSHELQKLIYHANFYFSSRLCVAHRYSAARFEPHPETEAVMRFSRTMASSTIGPKTSSRRSRTVNRFSASNDILRIGVRKVVDHDSRRSLFPEEHRTDFAALQALTQNGACGVHKSA